MELFKLFGSVMVDTDKANESLAKTDEKAEGLGEKLSKGVKTAAKWSAGLTAAAGAVGGAMIASAKSTATNADVIDKASKRMKISSTSYQELSHAAGLCGVEMSTMEKAAKALEGTDLSMDEALEQIWELGTAEERSAKAAELFGEAAAYQMSPMLMESAESMEAMKQEAHDLGLVMSEDAVTAGAEMNDAFSKVEGMVGSVKNQIGSALMPIIADLLNWVMQHMPEIQAFIAKVMDYVKDAIPVVIGVIQTIAPIVEGIFTGIGELWTNYLQPIFAGIIEFLEGVFTGSWEKIFSGLGKFVETTFKAVVDFIKIPINEIIKLLNKAIDGFNMIQLPDWVPGVGGYGLNIPHIPMLAKGGEITSAGTVLVGEQGPEFLNLPTGAKVTPLDKAQNIDYDKLASVMARVMADILPSVIPNYEPVSDETLFQRVANQSVINAAYGRAGIVV